MHSVVDVDQDCMRELTADFERYQNCQDKFNEVAQSDRFTYIGNTPIGTSWPHKPHSSLPLMSIAPHYDALLLSYGASRDRALGIPGEQELEGVISARAFVGWYNGLPEYRNLNPRLDGENAVIIGQGNVALDVARILLSSVDALRCTDITSSAIEALSKSRVKHVKVVGRRGILQAAFTAKELREMLALPGVGFHPVPQDMLPSDLSGLSRQSKRILQILAKGQATALADAEKTWELKFLRSPAAFLPSDSDASKLGDIKIQKMQLEDPHSIWSTTARAVGTDEYETLAADVSFRSIGYLSEAIPGLEELNIPFNTKRGLVPNEDGRVVIPSESEGGTDVHVPGVYTSGWVKRGPTGVIASTMYDAFDTADAIVNDWTSGTREFMKFGNSEERAGWDAVKPVAEARGIRSVSWEEWQRIDAAEKDRGQKVGKAREKFTDENEMLEVLK